MDFFSMKPITLITIGLMSNLVCANPTSLDEPVSNWNWSAYIGRPLSDLTRDIGGPQYGQITGGGRILTLMFRTHSLVVSVEITSRRVLSIHQRQRTMAEGRRRMKNECKTVNMIGTFAAVSEPRPHP